MLNAGMVNAPGSYFPPPCFCRSFAVFGQIPRSQNPVKYGRGIEINLELPLHRRNAVFFLLDINALQQGETINASLKHLC